MKNGGSDPTRNLGLELVRVTEAAALAAARFMGRGDKEAADGAGRVGRGGAGRVGLGCRTFLGLHYQPLGLLRQPARPHRGRT